MNQLEAMAILVETVDSGSLSAAGRRMNIPLPTLSRKLGELESHLGTRLMIRTTRRLELTDAGIAYVDMCRSVLQQVGEADRAAAGEYTNPKGELVITAPVELGRMHVLPLVVEFLALHPDITVRLALSDSRVDLVSEHVDLAVRIGRLPDSSLVAVRIANVRWVVVASPQVLSAHGIPKTPDDLADRPCVGIDRNNLDTSWVFRRPGSDVDRGTPIRSRMVVSNAEAAVEAAVLGAGFTQVLHYQAAAAIAAGRLRVVLKKFEATALPLSLVHPQARLLPLKTRSFLSFASGRLRAAMERKVSA